MKRYLLYIAMTLFATMQTFAQTYTYDNLNRLTKVVYGNGVTVTYGYDALGNRTSKKVAGATGVTYTITTNVSPSGSGTVTGGGTYASGTTVELSAIANDGYTFSKWSDGVTENPRTITVNSNVTLTAVFIKKENPTDGPIILERKYKVWSEGSGVGYSYQRIRINFNNGQVLRFCYLDTNYWGGSYSNNRNGVYVIEGNGDNNQTDKPYTKEWLVCPLVTNEWINEKIVITKDGKVSYYKNNVLMGEEQFSINWSDATKLRVDIDPTGWWTTHYHYMDDFHITTPITSIYDNFDNGVLNTDIWMTPQNPDGVRVEDGILKTEQIRTDNNFHLWSQLIPINDESENDLTDLVSVTKEAWHAANYCSFAFAPMAVTRIAPMVETYEETTLNTGEKMYQELTGLENGDYVVEVYANAQYTDGRGFSSSLTDGATDVVYVSANDERTYVEANIGVSVEENGVYSMNTTVSDGTLRIGMMAEKPGTNWHTIQIKRLLLKNKHTAISDVINSSDESPAFIYNLSGQRVYKPVKGVYIKNGKKILFSR